MFNLLPQEQNKDTSREYWHRLTAVSLIFILLAVLIGIVFLLPSYLISTARERRVSAEYELLKKSLNNENFDELNAILKTTAERLDIVKKSDEKSASLVRAIAEALRRKEKGVKINLISSKSGLGGEGELTISGFASSRERLLSFKKSLESDKIFSKVELPISNFAKFSDIDFSIKLNGQF